MKPALLFLAHRIPYPPNKGDKIRSYHLLRYLVENYRVYLGAFIDDAADAQYADSVSSICAQTHFVRQSPRRGKLRSLQGFLKGSALSLPFYWDAGLARWVNKLVESEGLQRVFVFSSPMAQYVYGEAFSGMRRVIDYVDVDSDKWRQYAPTCSWPMSWVYEREARKLLAFERDVIEDFDSGFFVSKHEAELFRRLAPEFAGKIGHVNNGVDLAYFSPHLDFVDPYSENERALVFVGAMDYWPNIDAVSWFAEHVFPLVRARVPAAHFYIVGGNPAPQVRALGRHPGITVTGRVDDVRPYVSHANVAVAPLRIARGVQNKVLESMAMAKPTVVTPAALEGIEAEPGSELLLANDAAGFAAKTCEVLEGVIDGRVLGDAARRRVELAYGWQSNLVSFGRLLEGETTPAGLMDRTAYG